jgi:hypothetical protein
MGRLWQSGLELNSATSAVECDTISGAGVSIDSSIKRTGSYSLKLTSSNGTRQGIVQQFASAAGNGPFYLRFYIYIGTAPTGNNGIAVFSSGSLINSAIQAYIYMTSSSTLVLNYNNAGSLTQIGSASSALSTATWYRIELKVDKSGGNGANIVEGLIDGVSFASASNLTIQSGSLAVRLGTNMAANPDTAGVLYFDDVAINDSTGSFQTGYPGSGQIIHLKPSSAGDSNGFLAQVGGTAGSTNNFTRVNEIPPDDATSYNGAALLSAEDLFNCDDSGIASGDTVNVVAVGVRMADLVGADATAAFKLEIEKTSGGTKSQSATLIPNSTSWITNASAVPRNYPLVTYQDPDSSNWTQSTLDSMQIGYIQTATNVQTIAVSNVWASVDYTLALASSTASTLGLMGIG